MDFGDPRGCGLDDDDDDDDDDDMLQRRECIESESKYKCCLFVCCWLVLSLPSVDNLGGITVDPSSFASLLRDALLSPSNRSTRGCRFYRFTGLGFRWTDSRQPFRFAGLSFFLS
jgi:hypothetical protein